MKGGAESGKNSSESKLDKAFQRQTRGGQTMKRKVLTIALLLVVLIVPLAGPVAGDEPPIRR